MEKIKSLQSANKLKSQAKMKELKQSLNQLNLAKKSMLCLLMLFGMSCSKDIAPIVNKDLCSAKYTHIFLTPKDKENIEKISRNPSYKETLDKFGRNILVNGEQFK